MKQGELYEETMNRCQYSLFSSVRVGDINPAICEENFVLSGLLTR